MLELFTLFSSAYSHGFPGRGKEFENCIPVMKVNHGIGVYSACIPHACLALPFLRFPPEATEQEVFLARYLSPEGPELEVSRSVRAVRVQDDRWILSGHSGAEQGRRGQGAMSLRVIPFLTYM